MEGAEDEVIREARRGIRELGGDGGEYAARKGNKGSPSHRAAGESRKQLLWPTHRPLLLPVLHKVLHVFERPLRCGLHATHRRSRLLRDLQLLLRIM